MTSPSRSELRQQLLSRRQALSSEQHASYSSAICEHLRASFPQLATMRVAFCWPIKNEADVRPLMRGWLAQRRDGFAALLPVVLGASAALGFRAWMPETDLAFDRYGIPFPADGEFIRPEALLIPVNGFDAQGYRLGYGGGFFDRTLDSLAPKPLAIGVGFELSRVETTAPQAHDVRLDAVVTEAGTFQSPRAR